MNVILIPLTCELSGSDLRIVKIFSQHFQEFWSNYEDLILNDPHISWSFYQEKNGRMHSDSLPWSTHRLKGLFLDYRKFHQQREDIHFGKVAKLLKKICADDVARDCIDRNRDNWNMVQSPIIGWRNELSIVDVVEALFNEWLFHAKQANRTEIRLVDLDAAFSSEALWKSVFLVVHERLMVLRNLHWIMTPLLAGRDELQIPDHS